MAKILNNDVAMKCIPSLCLQKMVHISLQHMVKNHQQKPWMIHRFSDLFFMLQKSDPLNLVIDLIVDRGRPPPHALSPQQ